MANSDEDFLESRARLIAEMCSVLSPSEASMSTYVTDFPNTKNKK